MTEIRSPSSSKVRQVFLYPLKKDQGFLSLEFFNCDPNPMHAWYPPVSPHVTWASENKGNWGELETLTPESLVSCRHPRPCGQLVYWLANRVRSYAPCSSWNAREGSSLFPSWRVRLFNCQPSGNPVEEVLFAPRRSGFRTPLLIPSCSQLCQVTSRSEGLCSVLSGEQTSRLLRWRRPVAGRGRGDLVLAKRSPSQWSIACLFRLKPLPFSPSFLIIFLRSTYYLQTYCIIFLIYCLYHPSH